jgi:beta-N-acetylhexosaminidase
MTGRATSARPNAAGFVFGRELRACFIDMDLAPVVDVNTNPKNQVIGDRSFGTDTRAVGAMVGRHKLKSVLEYCAWSVS